MTRVRVLVSVMLLALTGPAAAQAPQKKFMRAPAPTPTSPLCA